MPYDGFGNYVRNTDWTADRDAGIKILADKHDIQDDDFAGALTQCITRDGQSSVTADIPLNGHRLTNVGDAINPQDAATLKQLDAKLLYDKPLGLTGNDERGRLVFSGVQSPLATGKPLGLQFNQADMFFGVKPTDVTVAGDIRRFIWNNKFDGSGADVMTLDHAGKLTMVDATVKKTTTPTLALELDKSAANNDVAGNLDFKTQNSSSELKTWGRITTTVTDRVVGTEDATMLMQILRAGTFVTALTIDATGVWAARALRSLTGRVIAQVDASPSVTCYAPAQSKASGMWLASDNRLAFGDMDGNGNPTATHMTVDATALSHIGDIAAGDDIAAGGDLSAAGALVVMN